jgi:hypothetical protein
VSKRTTSTHHAKEQLRCEVSKTLKGGYCENPGTHRTTDGLLCEQHARQLGLEERIACWEAILLHIELWSKAAHRRGREDIVRGFSGLSRRRLLQHLSVHMKTLSRPKTKAISVRRERSTGLCLEEKGNRRLV